MGSLLYGPQFKSSEAELRKNHVEYLQQQSQHHHQQQQQQQESSGLIRYRSAPTSVLLDLVDNSGGAGCDDFRDFPYPRPSSPEVETVLSRFISLCNVPDSDNGADHSAHRLFRERPVKQETGDSVSNQNGYSNSPQMMYQTQQLHPPLDNASSFDAFKSSGLENSMQSKLGVGNRSNLVRQSSSPAGFFPNLNVDNGLNLMKDASRFGVSNGTNGEAATPSTSRLSTQFSFSSTSPPYSTESRRLPRIAETGNGNIGEGSDPDQSLRNATNGGTSHYLPDYLGTTWDNSAFHDLKRGRDNDGTKFSTSTMDAQNVDFGHRSHGLTQHLSLPKHFEMPGMEKLLHFQDSVPCKIRAKRGFATHPRSIAERMRRTRISERMRKLQDLFPNMDKQTNTAEMLDLAVEYIKDLQKEVKTLTDTKAKCSCSNRQKHN